ncbi:MAG: hypothetical protein DSY33_06230 [Archaeoglobus sp.]|nr:MAG: hypothetical protein DSY33_06230 [Archaeoglobus sp.]
MIKMSSVMKLKAFHLLILFGSILLITAMQLSLATLAYKLVYFCIGGSFGVLMALAILSSKINRIRIQKIRKT